MLQYELYHSIQRFLAEEEEQQQLDIQEVSLRATITLAVISILVGALCIFAIGFMIHHRKHMVMQLAQSPFLVAMSFCCLISSIFTFTNLPTRDIFCKMRGLLVDFPLTTSAIIVLARAWRVHVTLSNANMFARARANQSKDKYSFGRGLVAVLTFLARLPFRLWNCKDKTSATLPARNYNLRQKATAKETVSLIVILAIPDLCIQIVGVTAYNPQLELHIYDDMNTARYVCGSDARSLWVQQFSLAWMVAIFAFAIAIAWIGRDLPTAFNEKNAIFNTAAINAVLLLVILWILETDKTSTSPDTSVYLRCVNIFGLSVSMLVNIVMPKIWRVMSGEKVVLTHILTKYNDDHKGRESDVDHRRPTALQSTTPDPVVYTAGPTIKLKREDPLPPSLEKEIYSTLGLLGQVSKLCGEGRTPSASDWHAMRVYVAKLKMELDRVEIDFVDENSTDHLQVATTAGGVRDILHLNRRGGGGDGGGGGGTAAGAAAAGMTNNDLDGIEHNDDDGANIGDDNDYDDDDDDGDDGSAGS